MIFLKSTGTMYYVTGEEDPFGDDIQGEPGGFFGFGGEEFAGRLSKM